MTGSFYSGYPFRTLGEWQLQLIKDGVSPERARSRIDTELASGILELKEPLPFRRLQSRSRGELDIETTDGRLIRATDLEARYRPPPPAEPGLLGPTVPVSDALRPRIMARIHELGGAYVISPDGVGFMLGEPASEPVEDKPSPTLSSIEEQGIKLLAERLRQDQKPGGCVESKDFYQKLLKQELGIGVNRFDYEILPAALKEPGVKPLEPGRRPKK